MPFQPVPNTIHVALNGTLHGELVQNNLYFRSPTGEPNEDQVQDIANAMNTWWQANLRPLQGPAFTLRNVVATSLESAIDLQYTSTVGLPLAGTASGATMPGNVALTISFRTGLSGRSARGRNYFPGLTEDQVTGNTVASATVNAIAAAYSLLLSTVVTEGLNWVVVQRYQNNLELPAGITRPIVSVTVVDVNVDSQRRRLAGRGA